MDILYEIVANKRREIARDKASGLYDKLAEQAHMRGPARSMRASLAASPAGVIAEFKRRSPSKGWIYRNADPRAIAMAYQQAGASAISVLTDSVFFGGSAADLTVVRGCVDLPILRKDFIIDEVQIAEAAAIGADAVLLIAAALSPEQCGALAKAAHNYGLETLLEIHSDNEIDYVDDNIDMVGVNNRNLGTFHTDVTNSFKLAGLLPKDKILVSESGISASDTVARLRATGYRGFLIGEAFMRSGSPGNSLSQLIRSLSLCS